MRVRLRASPTDIGVVHRVEESDLLERLLASLRAELDEVDLLHHVLLLVALVLDEEHLAERALAELAKAHVVLQAHGDDGMGGVRHSQRPTRERRTREERRLQAHWGQLQATPIDWNEIKQTRQNAARGGVCCGAVVSTSGSCEIALS